jgi:hypothetical protein
MSAAEVLLASPAQLLRQFEAPSPPPRLLPQQQQQQQQQQLHLQHLEPHHQYLVCERLSLLLPERSQHAALPVRSVARHLPLFSACWDGRAYHEQAWVRQLT